MKGFGVVLLCVIAAAQARSAAIQSDASPAALGENPWLVHLRIAVSTSGLLDSCVGTLVSSTWVLTTANCVQDARFIWIRYGAVDVIHPELVTETSAVRLHPSSDIALVRINRVVESTENISPIGVASEDAPLSAGKACGYGGVDNVPGEQLACKELSLEASESGSLVVDERSSKFDLGAPLVSDGALVGILVSAGESSVFLNVAPYADWIQEELSASSAVVFVDA